MSNGYGGIGGIENETGAIYVGAWWSSSDSGVEVTCTPAMPDLLGDHVRLTNAEARQLLHLLNEALA